MKSRFVIPFSDVLDDKQVNDEDLQQLYANRFEVGGIFNDLLVIEKDLEFVFNEGDFITLADMGFIINFRRVDLDKMIASYDIVFE